jgi:hypothetical protein
VYCVRAAVAVAVPRVGLFQAVVYTAAVVCGNRKRTLSGYTRKEKAAPAAGMSAYSRNIVSQDTNSRLGAR